MSEGQKALVITRNERRVRQMAKGKSRGSSGGKSSGGGHYRSAKTGRYVTDNYGKTHPNTTVKESK
jgi:hypothetical protein